MRFGLAQLCTASAALLRVPAVLAAGGAPAPDLDVESRDSIANFAAFQVHKIFERYYDGNQTGKIPGLLNDPAIYWWEAGAVFGAMIDYWYYTGDNSNNPAITQALIHQAAPTLDYEPVNQTRALGNDDQAFWAIAAMAAAEKRFPELPKGEGPGWLALVERVWQRQQARWEPEFCGGGMRWQIPSFNQGYNYKNVVSNGLFFQLGARLARYTGNSTYKEWADKSFDWMENLGLLDAEGGNVYDGGIIPDCTGERLRKPEWTYNTGIIMLGAAFMWNISEPGSAEAAKWEKRMNTYLGRSLEFHFRTDIKNLIYEPACEYWTPPSCNQDQVTFKGYWARFLSLSAQLAPFIQDRVSTALKTSASYAARTCTGGPPGDQCGMLWFFNGGGVFDGRTGVGEELAVLEMVQSLLVPMTHPIDGGAKQGVKYITKGESRGIAEDEPPESKESKGATTGDKAGAWILTLLVAVVPVGAGWWAVRK